VKISDNPQYDEDEPEIYFCAAQHAREVITPEVLIYFMKYLTDNYATDPEVAFLVNNRELFFSPCLNPDGYYYNELQEPNGGGMWRKNRRDNGDGSFGVDLNRNYGYQWAYDDTGSSPVCSLGNYRGTAAFSEPEALAVKNFVLARHFTMIIDYHSCLVRFYYPWAYDRIYTEDNGLYQSMGDSVRIATGYIATLPWVWDSKVNGAYTDWGYSELDGKPKTYSVAVEVGSYDDPGFWPPTDSIGPLVQLHIQPNLFYARIADDPPVLTNPDPPSIHSPGGHVTSSSFTLYWHHSDVHNPAVSYQVMQSTSPGEITEDFETSFYPWTARGFSVVDTVSHSGQHSFYSGQGFGLDQTLTAGQAIQVDPGDTLRFWTRYNICGYDYGYVETSTDGGLTWTTMPGEDNITTNLNPYGRNNLGNGITGESQGWVLAKFDLGGYVGQEILIRFRFLSLGLDQETTFGWYVDDISPLDFFEQTTMLADAAVDTSLFVEDLVRGNYYYQVRARDAENQISPPSSPQLVHCSEGITCDWLVGDADGNGSYDIDDVVYLVAYIFSGGPAPTPNSIGSGDADCNDEIDIDDVVYLVAFIFSGGPSPAPTCDCADY
jgi:hypothetical protein